MQTHDHKFSFEMFICVLGGYKKIEHRFTTRHKKYEIWMCTFYLFYICTLVAYFLSKNLSNFVIALELKCAWYNSIQ